MEQDKQTRTKWLTIRMTEAEYLVVENLSKQTTCQSISDYARKTLMKKPIVRLFRNESLDDFTNKMLLLMKDLRSIGSNFNQMVRRLHKLHHVADIKQWIVLNEHDKTHLLRLIETISNAINKANEIWSRD